MIASPHVGQLARHAVRTAVRMAALVRPAVPGDAIAVGMELVALLSADAPDLTMPKVRRVLLVAPHPDDETIGCGGTVARLATTGTRVSVVSVTDGEATVGSPHTATVTARRRRAEAQRACRRLGVEAPIALGVPDGEVEAHRDEVAAALRCAIERFAPDLAMAPWSHERHPDHRATTRALVDIAPAELPVWGYEVHTAIPRPSHVIDVTATLAAKRAALVEHVTAGLAFDLEACLGLTRWRSLITRAGAGAAEAFVVLPAAELPPRLDHAERFWSRRGSAAAP